MEETLGTWLKREARRNGYSLREVGRRAGVSQTTISRIARDMAENVSAETVAGLAAVFDANVVDVYRLAGLLPDDGAAPLPVRLEQALRRLSMEDQQRIIDLAQWLADAREQPQQAPVPAAEVVAPRH